MGKRRNKKSFNETCVCSTSEERERTCVEEEKRQKKWNIVRSRCEILSVVLTKGQGRLFQVSEFHDLRPSRSIIQKKLFLCFSHSLWVSFACIPTSYNIKTVFRHNLDVFYSKKTWPRLHTSCEHWRKPFLPLLSYHRISQESQG